MLFPDVTPTLHADMPFTQFSIGPYLSPPLSALLLAGSLPGYVMSRYHVLISTIYTIICIVLGPHSRSVVAAYKAYIAWARTENTKLDAYWLIYTVNTSQSTKHV